MTNQPETPHQLSDEQYQQIFDFMRSKGVNAICPSCNARDDWGWGLLINPVPWTPETGSVVGSISVPMIEIICNNCAFVRLFAVKKILYPDS